MMQVVVRSLNPRLDDSSCPQTTGTPRMSLAISRTASSCSGLRIERYPDTARPSILPRTDSRKPLTASTSKGSFGSPW